MIRVLSCRLAEGGCRPGAPCSREWMPWWSGRHRPPSGGWWGLGRPSSEGGDCYVWPAHECSLICDHLATRGTLSAAMKLVLEMRNNQIGRW